MSNFKGEFRILVRLRGKQQFEWQIVDGHLVAASGTETSIVKARACAAEALRKMKRCPVPDR